MSGKSHSIFFIPTAIIVGTFFYPDPPQKTTLFDSKITKRTNDAIAGMGALDLSSIQSRASGRPHPRGVRQ